MLRGRETEIWREKRESKRDDVKDRGWDKYQRLWYRYKDRKLRICSGIKENTHNCITHDSVLEAAVLMEKQKHDWIFFYLIFASSHLPPLSPSSSPHLSSRHSCLSPLSLSLSCFLSLIPSLFSNKRISGRRADVSWGCGESGRHRKGEVKRRGGWMKGGIERWPVLGW